MCTCLQEHVLLCVLYGLCGTGSGDVHIEHLLNYHRAPAAVVHVPLMSDHRAAGLFSLSKSLYIWIYSAPSHLYTIFHIFTYMYYQEM